LYFSGIWEKRVERLTNVEVMNSGADKKEEKEGKKRRKLREDEQRTE